MNQHSISSFQKHKFIQLSLHSKYNTTIAKYNHYKFNSLLHNKSLRLALISKEQGIDDRFEDYLKRYYYATESIMRIPQMSAYYKNYLIIFGVPTFRHLILNSQIHSFATKKAEVYYNNHCHKEEDKISSLESNSNVKQPAESNPGVILTETMIERIENKTEQSSVSLVFNEQDMNSDKFKVHNPLSKEESLLTILLMIDPVTDVLKDKMKKISSTLNTKSSVINKVSTVDKTKTAKEDINDNNGEKGISNNKIVTKKSRNKNLNSCGLLNTITTNNEITIKTKQNKKYSSMANNLNDFKTFFHQINSIKIKQLVKQIKSSKNQKEQNNNIATKRNNMPHNSPDKSRSNFKSNNNDLTTTYKNSDFIHFTFQPSYVAMNEYNTLKPKHAKYDTNNNTQSYNRNNHKSNFSLTAKNMPIYITNNNDKQSTQENIKSSLTISDTEKSKTKNNRYAYNKVNLNAKSSNFYFRKTKANANTRPKCKELSLNKDQRLKSYFQLKDSSSNISRPHNIKENSQKKIHVINTYLNKKQDIMNRIKLVQSKEHKSVYYLTTQEDNNEKSIKPSVKIQINKVSKANAKNVSDKKKKNQISSISLTKKKNHSITLDMLKNYELGHIMSKIHSMNK